MPATKLAVPVIGMGVEELTDLMFRYYRELEYLLNGNLDSENVRSITTDKLIAGTALIDTALITTLVVGTNVGQGSAPKVFSSEPTTPYRVNDIWIDGTDLKRCVVPRVSGAYVATDWSLGTNYTNPTGVTSIVGGVVTTDYVNALNVTAASVAAENITGTKITGKTIVGGKFMNSAETYQLTLGLIGGDDAVVFSKSNGDRVFAVYDTTSTQIAMAGKSGSPILVHDGTSPGTTYPFGMWDFTSAGVSNFPGYTHTHDDRYFTETESDNRFAALSHNHTGTYAPASHDHGNAYIKANDDVYIQYFSDHMEIKLGSAGTWKVISYDP